MDAKLERYVSVEKTEGEEEAMPWSGTALPDDGALDMWVTAVNFGRALKFFEICAVVAWSVPTTKRD